MFVRLPLSRRPSGAASLLPRPSSPSRGRLPSTPLMNPTASQILSPSLYASQCLDGSVGEGGVYQQAIGINARHNSHVNHVTTESHCCAPRISDDGGLLLGVIDPLNLGARIFVGRLARPTRTFPSSCRHGGRARAFLLRRRHLRPAWGKYGVSVRLFMTCVGTVPLVVDA